MRRGVYLVISAMAVGSCTQILGIDGHYVLEAKSDSSTARAFGSGGTEEAGPETGGELGTGGDGGGSLGSGGIVAAGGMLPIAGGYGGTLAGSGGDVGGAGNGPTADSQAPCGSGQKRCAGGCVTPDPSVGCGVVGCDQCPGPPPANGYLVCAADQCGFACAPSFTKDTSKGTCDPPASGSGGASSGGTGGTGGGTGRIGSPCTVKLGPPQPSSQCVSCGAFPGCCDPVTARCGCLYVAACI